MGLDDLTFSFGDMVQIVGAVLTLSSAWWYMRNQFQSNKDRLTNVEIKLDAHGTEMTEAVNTLGIKIDEVKTEVTKQNVTIARIEAHGNVLEQKLAAIAGPRAL